MCNIDVLLLKGKKHQYTDKKIHLQEGNLKIDAVCHGDAAENLLKWQNFNFLAGKIIKSLARDDV